MSTFGATTYGTSTFGARVQDAFASETLTASPTRYGEATLTWELPPGSWSSIRVVRNASGTPIDVNDGDVLFTDDVRSARTSYVDTGLTMGRFYYYRQFVLPLSNAVTPFPQVGQWVPTGAADVLTVQFSGAIERLYTRLPAWHRDGGETSLAERGVAREDTFLYRFLMPMGYHLDALRTDTAHLLQAYDANTVGEVLLPSLGASYGVPYEPILGARSVRRLIDNASRLWKAKGTLTGIRELANVVTGYGAHVRVGYNLVLDNGDAGPLGTSHWRLDTGVAGTINFELTPTTTNYRDGVQRITFPAGATGGTVHIRGSRDAVSGVMFDALGAPMDRLQHAIPVIPGLPYSVRYTVQNDSASGAVSFQSYAWCLDTGGNPLTQPTTTVSVLAGSGPQHIVLDVPASAARYIEPGISISGVPAGGASLQVSEMVVAEMPGSFNAPPAPSREILVYLDAALKNWVTNTDGGHGDAADWSTNVVSRLDPTYGQYLTTQNTGAVPIATLLLDDGFMVGDPAAPDAPPPEPTKTTDLLTLRFTGAQVRADPGDTWTVMAEALDPDLSVGTRTGQIGFELYDGPDLIGVDYGPLVNLVAGTWYTLAHTLIIPPNATYSSLMMVVRVPGGGALATGVRKATFVKSTAAQTFMFDGSTPSLTGDYLWRGTPYASPSYYYPRRAPRVDRLSKMLAEYVPDPARYRFVYATDVDLIPDSPRAVSGSDINPDYTPAQTVGIESRLRWNVKHLVGIDRTLVWQIFGTPVGRSTAIRWNTLINHGAFYATVGKSTRFIWNDLVDVQVGLSTQFKWSVNESIEEDDALMVEGGYGSTYAQSYSATYGDQEIPGGPGQYTGVYTAAYNNAPSIYTAAFLDEF
jgi:hypothetical protein